MTSNCLQNGGKVGFTACLTWWQVSLLGLLLFIAFFYGIGGYAIADMNEGLYAEIAREMLARHDFIIPYLNFVPYL